MSLFRFTSGGVETLIGGLGSKLFGGSGRKRERRAGRRAAVESERARELEERFAQQQTVNQYLGQRDLMEREQANYFQRLSVAQDLKIKEMEAATKQDKEILAEQQKLADRELEITRVARAAPVTVPVAVQSDDSTVPILIAAAGIGALILLGRK